MAAAIDGLSGEAPLAALADAVAGCTRCPLAATRTQVVFGSGSPTADLMFVGEAPGLPRGQAGRPVRRRRRTAARASCSPGSASPARTSTSATCSKCRPPGNRDPLPEEIEACESHLFRQIELIEPQVVATLGNFATKLLSGKPDGITRVHGREQEVTLGGSRVLLYPIFHPAAALYTPRMLDVLQADFERLPELLGREVAAAPPVALAAGARARARRGPARPLLAPARSRGELRAGSRAAVRRSETEAAGGAARPGARTPATSSASPASSAPARRPSSAAPAARSASPRR